MNSLEFVFSIFNTLCWASEVAFLEFLIWRYLDLKYFSTSEIELLKEENKYLKEENKKVNGSSSDFFGKDYGKL